MAVIRLDDYKKKKRFEDKKHKLHIAVYRRSLLEKMRTMIKAGQPVNPKLILLFAESFAELGEPVDPKWQALVAKAKSGEEIRFS